MEHRTKVRLGAGLLLASLALALGWVLAHIGLVLYVDALWFGALGYSGVLWTIVAARFLFGAVAFVLTLTALGINMRLAYRLAPLTEHPDWEGFELDHERTDHALRIVFRVLIGLVALVMAASVAANWRDLLQFQFAVPFDITDPVFNNDVGFYVFRLPAIAYARKIAFLISVLTLSTVACVYYVRGAIAFSRKGRLLPPAAFGHMSILSSVAAALFAGRFWVAQYQLLYSKRGAVFGASYTDLHAQMGAYKLMLVVCLVLALWLFVNAFLKKRPANLYILIGVAGLWAVTAGVYPWAYQSFVVQPNELTKEEPYISRNITYTRHAYGLTDIESRAWPGDGALSPEVLAAHAGTTENLQIWDGAPLKDLYDQKQRIRSYYTFHDVDVDRYLVEGRLQPVMVAARELDSFQLPERSRIWTNLHLQYTHGYGLCMSLANRVNPGGVPQFLISNIPPEATADLNVAEPRIYFGERTRDYVLTHTLLDEFDHPGDPDNVYNRYDGEGGITLKGRLRRALFAWFTGEKDILFTEQFTDDSRILLFREVGERVRRIAPFIHFDTDPYPVLYGGRIVWIVDGYTLTRRFPYSERVGQANYWRNAVKATVDAYDGTVTFYNADPEDPIITMYERMFPGLFKPPGTMPAALRAHLRYPKDMFLTQTYLYCRYHMDDPQLFFNNEDLWDFPKTTDGKDISYELPRYVVMEMPGGEGGAEFLLVRTFTVKGKDNMIAWVAAGCDPNRYGALTVYRLPKRLNIYGPNQVKGRFNQDPEVSAFTTLMGQHGSAVVQSKVFAVPIDTGILYLQGLYVVDPEVKIPELKQIVVGHGDRVAMAPDIGGALSRLFADMPAAARPTTDAPANVQGLYDRALDRLKAADWAGFGEAFDALGEALGESR